MTFPVAAGQWLALDELSTVPAVMVAGLMAAILTAAPRRDVDAATCAQMLVALGGVLMVYAAGNVAVLFAGWALSAIPFMRSHVLPAQNKAQRHQIRWFARPAVALGGSVVLVAVAVALVAMRSDEVASRVAFVLVVLGALIRSGVFPFHSWVVASFESDALLPYAWLLSARTGAMLLAKFMMITSIGATRPMAPVVNDLALFSSVLMAVIAMGENTPRRVLGLVVVSQSGFIIAGLQTGNVPGVTGALVQWIVVSVSAAGIAILLRCLEERYGALLQERFAGLGAKTPRMAVLFLLFALALVGFPGTLGFSAEDLLFHGALEAHPILGIALPVATTLIAIRLLQLFSSMFLGRRAAFVPAVSDALPRERWVLTGLIALLVLTGLAPQAIIDSRARPAQAIASAGGNPERAANR
jgi:NADH-quinone oxidoreductase subunit M